MKAKLTTTDVKMELGHAGGITVTYTRGSGELTKNTATASTAGRVEKFMMASGRTTKLKVRGK
jgi:hypothetical protein